MLHRNLRAGKNQRSTNKYTNFWPFDYRENRENYCHQMSHFKAEMHRSRILVSFCLFVCPLDGVWHLGLQRHREVVAAITLSSVSGFSWATSASRSFWRAHWARGAPCRHRSESVSQQTGKARRDVRFNWRLARRDSGLISQWPPAGCSGVFAIPSSVYACTPTPDSDVLVIIIIIIIIKFRSFLL